MRNGNERKSSSSSPRLDCEVGLGLKMQLQPTDSYYSCVYEGDGSGGGGPSFSSTSNQVPSLNNIYGVADSVPLQRSFRNTASGGIVASGKALFTASQWQELERQKMIHKYILASVPVPPQLLLPTFRSPPPTSLSQCNTSGFDLRFTSSGPNPEPWRCKRTDGKKWRCSRDVAAADQKYCERHAHKSRPRSRKLVEVSPHNTSNNTCTQKSLFLPSTTQSPTPTPASSYDQTRCFEWLTGGGSISSGSSRSGDTNSISTRKQQQQQQQWEQVMQISSSRMEFNRDNTEHDKNIPVYHPHFEDKQGFMSLNPYIPDTSNLHRPENNNHLSDGQCSNSILDRSLTTRHFIDAWEREGYDGMSSKGFSASLSNNFLISPSSSSLSLSMSGGNYDNEKGNLGIGMMNSDRDSDGILKPQWMTPVSWMNSSPPGGPLGEALGLGNATTTRGGLHLASPHASCNRQQQH